MGPPDPARGFVGRGTDLGVALDALADRFLGQRLRGVVLITDGLDRGQLRRTLREAPDAPLPALPGPLTIYQVGDATDLDVKTLALQDCRLPVGVGLPVVATRMWMPLDEGVRQ